MGDGKRILFCWSGGGLPGLDIHCGIWRALENVGIQPTENIGTSAGAIAAAFNSAGYSADQFDCILRGLSDRNVRRERFGWKLRVPFISSFLSHRPILNLLREYLPLDFKELDRKLTVHVTDERDCEGIDIRRGDLAESVLASMSIAGVFPPVELTSSRLEFFPHTYSDGGTTANLPVPASLAVWDEVYLLVAKRPVEYSRRSNSMLSRLMLNVDLLAEDQVRDTIENAKRRHPRVVVLRPPLDSPRGSLHFDHELIGKAREWTAGALRRITP